MLTSEGGIGLTLTPTPVHVFMFICGFISEVLVHITREFNNHPASSYTKNIIYKGNCSLLVVIDQYLNVSVQVYMYMSIYVYTYEQ